jgi:ubiquinone/menaquinone biosynthesis C-methylase UbiE
MSHLDEIREQQRNTWDRFSDGWAKWDDLTGAMLNPVGAEMIRSLELREDGQHLDIAAGSGEPGLSIAALMPRGRVVLTDLSAGMLEWANSNARRRRIANVEFRQCSVDALPFEVGEFDSISCRFGFMFFPDIPAALAEIVRVLRPGGRLSIAVWAEPPGNVWATIPMTAIGEEVAIPTPDPNAPGLFRCATAGSMARLFHEAGLRDVAETDVHGALEAASAEEYWTYVTEVAAGVVAGLAAADGPARERIRNAALARVASFERDGRPALPMHARCIVGTR